MGHQCIIPQKLLGDDKVSNSYRTIKVEVGLEWLVFCEEFVQCTAYNLAGIFCSRDVSTNGDCVCNIVCKIKCFLDKVALL